MGMASAKMHHEKSMCSEYTKLPTKLPEANRNEGDLATVAYHEPHQLKHARICKELYKSEQMQQMLNSTLQEFT